MDKYFELYRPGGQPLPPLLLLLGTRGDGTGGRGWQHNCRRWQVSRACAAARLPIFCGLPAARFACLPAGGGAAGGFIRVAISFLEPDQVRNGDLEGAASMGGRSNGRCGARRAGWSRAGCVPACLWVGATVGFFLLHDVCCRALLAGTFCATPSQALFHAAPAPCPPVAAAAAASLALCCGWACCRRAWRRCMLCWTARGCWAEARRARAPRRWTARRRQQRRRIRGAGGPTLHVH